MRFLNVSARSSSRSVLAALLIAVAGCAAAGPSISPSTAPPVAATPSLVEAKREVGAYVDSGRYEAELAAMVDQARAFLESRVPRGGKLAIVLYPPLALSIPPTLLQRADQATE